MGKNKDESFKLNQLRTLSMNSRPLTLLLYRKIVQLFGIIIDVDFDGFVGDTYEEDVKAERPTDMVDVATFGDYYFSMRDVLTVVTNYSFWLDRYGTKEAVGQEIIDWYDYATDDYTPGKNKVSLFAWLSGCPKEGEGGKDGTD